MPNEAKLSLLIIPTAGSVAMLPAIPEAVRFIAWAAVITSFAIFLSTPRKPREVAFKSSFDILEIVSSPYINKTLLTDLPHTPERKGNELEKALAMGVPIVPNYCRRE